MPPPFTIEHLCELPTSLAATAQVVRPCVAFLHSRDDKTSQDADPLVFPVVRLDAKEVESAFTAPLHNFLKICDEQPVSDKPEEWYSGSWTSFHGTPFRSMLDPSSLCLINVGFHLKHVFPTPPLLELALFIDCLRWIH
jgi:hypothetical protein